MGYGSYFPYAYDASLYLRAKYWFRGIGISEEELPPFSDRYYELMADISYIEEYHARVNGLIQDE